MNYRVRVGHVYYLRIFGGCVVVWGCGVFVRVRGVGSIVIQVKVVIDD